MTFFGRLTTPLNDQSSLWASTLPLLYIFQYNGKDIGDGHILRVSKADFGSDSMCDIKADKHQAAEDELATVFLQGGNLAISSNASSPKTQLETIQKLKSALPAESLTDVFPVAVLRNVYDPLDSSLDAEYFIDLEVNDYTHLRSFKFHFA